MDAPQSPKETEVAVKSWWQEGRGEQAFPLCTAVPYWQRLKATPGGIFPFPTEAGGGREDGGAERLMELQAGQPPALRNQSFRCEPRHLWKLPEIWCQTMST